MTDSLRDRIAAALAIHADYIANGIRHCTCGEWSGDSQTTRIGFAAHVADAVIEALGLHCETGTYDGFFGRKERRRYVTEWTTDECP